MPKPADLPDLSITEWAVLGALAPEPAHGFALSRALRREAPVGRVWAVPRPLVYRALGRLEEQELIRPHAIEPGEAGPQRTVFRIERRGRAAIDEWLGRPVAHLRDVRAELLLKLVLADELGADAQPLLLAQREVFAPLIDALAPPVDGIVDPVDRWRHESSQAVARLLDGLLTAGADR